MRWLVIILLMCNGIYFLWQYYLVPSVPIQEQRASKRADLGESLVLVGELDEAAKPSLKNIKNQELAGSSAQPVVESAICLMIGPFKEEVSGKQVLSRLQALEIRPEMEVVNVPGKPNYWVHIPPQPSRKVAIKLLRELQSKKVDSFLITEGELENGISLGIFTKLESAEQVSSKRSAQGYAAQVLTMPSSSKELWLVFDAEQTDKFSDALWETIQQGNPGLERRKNYCDKIAPSDNID